LASPPRRNLAIAGQRIQTGALYALLAALPFSKSACELLFAALMAGWLLERLSTRRTIWLDPSARAAALWAAAYLAACLLSIPGSRFPDISSRGFIGKWLEYVLLFLFAADASVQPGRLRRCAAILCGSAAVVAAWAISQELIVYGPFKDLPAYHFGRMTGPYENPIDLAIYLMVVIPVAAAQTAVSRGRMRWAYGALLAVLLGCFARTEALGRGWDWRRGCWPRALCTAAGAATASRCWPPWRCWVLRRCGAPGGWPRRPRSPKSARWTARSCGRRRC
jgi:hypothetical protein